MSTCGDDYCRSAKDTSCVTLVADSTSEASPGVRSRRNGARLQQSAIDIAWCSNEGCAKRVNILEKLAADAIRLGASGLEVDYKDGYEEILAVAGCLSAPPRRANSSSSHEPTPRLQ
jgi:hypothetical protein